MLFSRFLYSIFIVVLQIGFWLGRFFSKKINLGYQGRKNWRSNLSYQSPPSKKVLWMHVSSLGEFEQGRSVLEAFRKEFPNWHIVLSFFSPSGYELRKNYTIVDSVIYLPLDTKKNALSFIKKIKPDAAIFVKYDFWFHYLQTLKNQNCPTLLIAAKFRQDQAFFKSYGSLWRAMLFCFSHISLQDRASEKLIQSIGYQHTSVDGDPRIDRVLALPKEDFQNEKLAAFSKASKVLIMGSSWNIDMKIIAEYYNKQSEYKLLIVPHEPSQAAFQFIQTKFPTALAYTKSSIAECSQASVLVLDTIGMLNKAYRYGHIAYIGGGFGAGIHNVLEPSVYGLPVLFGPKHQKFEEALLLTKLGGGFPIASSLEFSKKMNYLSEAKHYEKAQKSIATFFKKSQGATKSIVERLKNKANQ